MLLSIENIKGSDPVFIGKITSEICIENKSSKTLMLLCKVLSGFILKILNVRYLI